jgi:LmbE family N-acetylglucosaminyl deacetylase
MATMVSFHAHPDDECIACGGVIRKASEEGHRVVLVVATRGERGEVPDGFLADGEELWQRRVAETQASAKILGAQRVEFLGYTDSGMMGEPSNDAPYCFWQADVEHAARTLAVLLDEEEPDVLTIYDDNGVYGHPDHIQVHRVGKRAGELSAVPVVAQGTVNRDWMQRGFRESGREGDIPPNMGKRESEITHRVEAVDFVAQKRASMRAHASQMAPDHFLLALPDAMFALGMGTEFYIVDPLPSPAATPDLFEELFTPLR